MPGKTNKILIVDNDESIRLLLTALLVNKGYVVTEAINGFDALEKIKNELPHLILLDLIMPVMNGYELIEELRSNVTTNHIPIIMLSAKNDIRTEIESFKHGIDDFITKPFKHEELLVKVHSILYRTYRGLDSNPLTRLPGNNSIRERMEEIINQNTNFAVCFLDIDNFKAFNDKYGFEHGDKAINLTAQIIIKSVQEHGGKNDFVGHIGGDDFVIITNHELMHPICKNIIEQFDESIKILYDPDDLQNGFIISKNRKGFVEQFPIMTISIGVVTNKKRKIIHSIEISEIGSEVKKYAKTFQKSNYTIDERGVEPSNIPQPLQSTIKNKTENYFFTNLEKDLPVIFHDVYTFFKKKGWVAILFIEITPTNDEDYKKMEVWKETMDNTFSLFLNSKKHILRDKDVVLTHDHRKEKLFIYVSSARNDNKIKSEDIEKLVSRIKDFLQSKDLNKNSKIDIMFGYSLINFSC